MILESLSTNVSTGLVFLVVFLLLWRLLRRSPSLPPGPWPLPLLGNVLQLGGDSRITLEKLREKYGDVYTVYLGRHPVVYVHGYHNIMEMLVTRGDDFLDRPLFFQMAPEWKERGIVFTAGKVWQEQRRFSIQALRDFGFGKRDIVEKIQEEVEVLINHIADMDGQPFDIQHLIHVSVSNVICSVVFGRRFEHDDPEFKTYIDILSENFKLINLTAMAGLVPFASHIPGDPFKMKRLRETLDIYSNFILSQIQAHKESLDRQNPRDFIDAYLKEMEVRRNVDPGTTLSEEQLLGVISDLFAGGTETTATGIRWAILLMLKYPDIQARVRQEIDSVVGGRFPSLDDRLRLPITEATIMEILRYTDIAPATHAAIRDLTFHGHFIPKGTTVNACVHCILNDKKVWDDPCSFNPFRFIDESGQLNKPEAFLPFSAGKRVCPGEALAKRELFLFLSAIVQRFELRLPDGAAEPDLTADLGITRSPRPFKFIAILRQ